MKGQSRRQAFSHSWESTMHDFLFGLGALRAPIVVALLFALLLIVPGQSREIVQVIFEGRGINYRLEIGRTLLALLFLSLTFLVCGFRLLQAASDRRREAIERFRPSFEAVALTLPLTPFLVLALVLIDIRFGRLLDDYIRSPVSAELIAGIALSLAALSYFSAFRGALWNLLERIVGLFGGITPLWATALAGATIVLLSVYIAARPTQLADVLGPVGVTCLFFGVLLISASLLTHLYDRYQIPGLAILAALAVLSAHFGLNENHDLRLDATSGPAAAPKKVSEAFLSWLAERPGISNYTSTPYTVYVVTAEGGGLYAAAHAAYTLATIHDHCPAFAQHVFAISAVSGGSLGAGLFAALVKTDPTATGRARDGDCPMRDLRNQGPMQKAVESYFHEDLLTPLLAAAAFPDFLQRFVPYRFPSLDRARALETGFEDAWTKLATATGRSDTQVFSSNFRSLWKPSEDVPALLFNATSVIDGERVVMAPFEIFDEIGFRYQEVDLLNTVDSLRFSAAVGASARFPYATPPAAFRDASSEIVDQLVDGGYYDNTGIQSAVDLIYGLKAMSIEAAAHAEGQCAKSNLAAYSIPNVGSVLVCFRAIALLSIDQNRDFKLTGEVLTPPKGVYQARLARGFADARMMGRLYCGGKRCGRGVFSDRPHFYVNYLIGGGLPLAWYFSESTLQTLFEITDTESCPKVPWAWPNPTPIDRVKNARIENACLPQRIARDLGPHETRQQNGEP